MNEIDKLIVQFEDEYPEQKEYLDSIYQEIIYRIFETGQSGLNYIKTAIYKEENNISRLRALIFGLGLFKDSYLSVFDSKEEAATLLNKYLNNSNPLIIAETIDTIISLELNLTDKVLSLYKHKSSYVKGAVIRFIARTYKDKAIPFLLEDLNSFDPIVKQNIIDELALIND